MLSPLRIATLYLASVTVLELITSFFNTLFGLALYALLLLIVLIYAARATEPIRYSWLLSLTFPPLIRLVSLALPLNQFHPLLNYVITGFPLLAAAFVAKHILRYTRQSIGLNMRAPFAQSMIALYGLIFAYIQFHLLHPRALVNLNVLEVGLAAVILIIFNGFTEEIIFRGIMQRAAQDMLGKRYGIASTTLVFTVMHIGYMSLPHLIFIAVTSIFFSIVVNHWGSIVGVTIAHGLANIIALIILPNLGA